jgi:hypothetical protein
MEELAARALKIDQKNMPERYIDWSSVAVLNCLSNFEYDRLLAECLPFVHLYDASANNVVLECIVRTTPVLVNPVGGVVEYLGVDYPLYFDSWEEAEEKLENDRLIEAAHNYLCELRDSEDFSREKFLTAFLTSEIYKSL